MSAVVIKPKIEGTWRITQPNGKQFLVHSSAKVGIAIKCGYDVERLDVGKAEAVTDLAGSQLAAIREAVADYHFALDTRQHGGVAQDRAFNVICNALGLHWQQGAELAKRRAEAESGESNQPNSTGKDTPVPSVSTRMATL